MTATRRGEQDGLVPAPSRPRRQPLTRADLPTELTPETLRRVGLRTLRELARPGNGVLSEAEQQQFDAALSELKHRSEIRAEQSLARTARHEPSNLDPALRNSYLRTQRRLAEQSRRAWQQLPAPSSEATDASRQPGSSVPAAGEQADDEEVSPDTLEQELDQTSETLDILERIAALQQQQLEHQQRQLLSDTRGFFFAFLVSVAVIVAGVAPLVEAEARDRVLIALWTLASVAVAGIAYAIVRWAQAHK